MFKSVATPLSNDEKAPEKNLKDIFKHGHHFGGHFVFCANLISAVVLEWLYRSCSNLVHQFIIK